MTRTNSLALLAVAALSGCGGGPGTGSDGNSSIVSDPGGTPALSLGFSVEVPAAAYTSVEAFELFTTTQVRVVTDVTNVGPDQAERLDLYAPTGNLWFSTVIPFSGATGSDRTVTVLPDGSFRSIYVLEVAGTPIETFQMTGAWRATATLEGTTTTASKTFALR
jgi:hypothetical protein